MNIGELWRLYAAHKQIKGFSPNTLKTYALQLKMLDKAVNRAFA